MTKEIKHYGVLGMKWGVRKDGMPQGYRNPGYDGPKNPRPRKSADRVKADQTASRSAASLSNKELQDHANRRRLESEFDKLTAAPQTTSQKLREETKKILANVARTQATYAANQVSRKYVDQLLESIGVEPNKSKKDKKSKKTENDPKPKPDTVKPEKVKTEDIGSGFESDREKVKVGDIELYVPKKKR